ncbi:MAG: ATP-dependent RNA helicase HrpA [Opitutales bacterium]
MTVSNLEAIADDIRKRLALCAMRDRSRLRQKLGRLWPARHPEKVAPKLEALQAQVDASVARVEARRAALPKARFPEALPISARAAEIVDLIRQHPVLVIAGETGSGKTTQLPKMCLAAGLGAAGKIGCTQPRRVAALSISRRVADELNVPWGQEVGAKIRFTDKTSAHTCVQFMTDGILLNELQTDPDLSEYEALIIDEAHERSLNIDFLLGCLRTLVRRRDDLRVIVTSATIDTRAFAEAFEGAPVVQVSGRTFPVSVEYRPLEDAEGEVSQLEVAAQTVEDIVAANKPGDILCFLPGEREIREVRALLERVEVGRAEVLPLFGRLSAAEQQCIFAPTQKRRIILATNIAETSLTLPGIRFGIDTGTARISRFSAHTRTQRLPIEPVSQSSADQRKGRAGRVAEGLCIRLYSEKDYEARPKYTPPEIRRSNLAAVILRLKAFGLGEVETFPFIDPPETRAITGGYRLLQDLGALDEAHALTSLGHELARLPVDPTVGRMLLQARREHCLPEVLVIAAGLSIQDPRERPMEQQEAADRMHRRFRHEHSDFLTLHNIWQAYHDEVENLTQRQLRRFCEAHFLSYLRMREWRDIHDQLLRVMRDLGDVRLDGKPAEATAVHRCLLVALPGNVGRKDEGNLYRVTHGRRARIFPGSVLFDRRAEKAGKKKKNETSHDQRDGRTPPWLLCAEWVETSQLFARTVARIEPRWLPELCGHLCKATIADPYWDAKAGRVLVRERLFLHGLEVASQAVAYGVHNMEEATDIFIRSGLVEDTLPEQLGFLEHNRRIRQRVEERQTRLRLAALHALDDRLYRFYSQRLENVSAVPELRRFINEHHGGDDAFLRLTEAQLLGGTTEETATEAFPDAVQIDGQALPLRYAYKPGESDDGATLSVPLEQFGGLQPGVLDWLVPGYIEERVRLLLRNLPKDKRRRLSPLNENARFICQRLEPSPDPLAQQVAATVRQYFDLETTPADWQEDDLPEHLRPRIELTDTNGKKIVAADRDWDRLRTEFRKRQQTLAQGGEVGPAGLWKRARAHWERTGLTEWTVGDVPETVEVGLVGDVTVTAWPALRADPDSTVSLVLLPTRDEALQATRGGWFQLAERELGREFAWLEKDLKDLRQIGPLLITLAPLETVRAQLFVNLRQTLLTPGAFLPLQETRYKGCVASARERLRGLVPRLIDQLKRLLELRQRLILGESGIKGLKAEAERLVPANVCERVPFTRLERLERYLRALEKRAERARLDPARDAEKAARIAPFVKAYNETMRDPKRRARKQAELEELRWLIEELKVSIYAQELGTSEPVSEKKLQAKVARLRAE